MPMKAVLEKPRASSTARTIRTPQRKSGQSEAITCCKWISLSKNFPQMELINLLLNINQINDELLMHHWEEKTKLNNSNHNTTSKTNQTKTRKNWYHYTGNLMQNSGHQHSREMKVEQKQRRVTRTKGMQS